jgi:hypothetical protein
MVQYTIADVFPGMLCWYQIQEGELKTFMIPVEVQSINGKNDKVEVTVLGDDGCFWVYKDNLFNKGWAKR